VNLQLYLSHLQRQIDQRWFPQRQSSSTTVVVLFSITRSGTLQDLSLVSSSGNAEADQAALAAVQQASARFGALPAGYERDSLEIKLTFRLE
jgi:TonB family protein